MRMLRRQERGLEIRLMIEGLKNVILAVYKPAWELTIERGKINEIFQSFFYETYIDQKPLALWSE